MPLDLARPLQPLLMTRASLEEQQRHKAGRARLHRHPRRLPGHSALCADLERRQHDQLALAEMESPHRPQMSLSGMGNTGHDIGGFAGPVPRRELLVRWTQAGAAASPLHHEFVEADGVYTSPWLHPERPPSSAPRSGCGCG